ncbi:type I secretion C-terminal target domain-containing protein [Undibacterium seohonense]|nr:type I secretion C-terminal target domain-containing protein [Undibacterium seohonense]
MDFLATSEQDKELTIVSVTPNVQMTALASTNIVISFSEPIVIGSGEITIRNSSNYQIILRENINSPLFSISGNVLTLNPSADFDFNKFYQIEIPAGFVKSLSGTPLTSRIFHSYYFQTDFSQTAIQYEGNSSNETIYGSSKDDTINGGGGADKIIGLTGDDILNGGDETDQWSGDNIEGGNGNDTLHGNNGNDFLAGGIGNDKLYGDADKDRLGGDEGDDYLDGGDGDDHLTDNNGNNTLIGGAGNDTLQAHNFGESRRNLLDGGSGNDILNATGSVEIKGGDGDDKIRLQNNNGSTSTSNLDGGAGNDQFAIYIGSGDFVTATGGSGRDTYGLTVSYIITDTNFSINDFTAGTDGDQIDLSFFINSYFDKTINPFADNGYLRLRQDGQDTLLKRIVVGQESTVARLKNVLLSELVADNFVGGIDPKGGLTGLTLTGTESGDSITGNIMNDTLRGLGGPDTLDGGSGNDTLIGGADNSSDDNDRLNGGFGHDLLQGGAGDDELDGNDDDDTLQGGAGNDTLRDHGGTNVFSGGAGDDTIYVGSNATVYGDDDNDRIIVQSPPNQKIRISGGTGSDLFKFNYQKMVDTVITDFSPSEGDQIDLNSSFNLYGYDRTGNPFGSSGFLRAEQVNNDVIISVDPDGAERTAESMTVILRLENTNLAMLSGLNFVGGWNPDGSEEGITINGTTANDKIIGLGLNDKLYGGDGSDSIYGGSGNDLIEGGDETQFNTGDDLHGETGNDTIVGGKGNDSVFGDSGNDSLDGGDGIDVIEGGDGNDTLNGGGGDDTLNDASGQNTLNGGFGNDILRGNGTGSLLDGGEGDDTLYSTAGNDTLIGGSGDDKIDISYKYDQSQTTTSKINAGDGNDEITIRTAREPLRVEAIGGAGIDTYKLVGGDFSNTLVILDFKTGSGGDLIGLFEILPSDFGDGNPFGSSGYFQLVQKGEDTVIEFDQDGAAKSAYGFLPLVTLSNVTVSSLTKANFLNGINPNGSQDGLDLIGTSAADTLTGDFLNDKLQGGAGNDILNGGRSGDDTLLGGAGNDNLYDRSGNDSLDGGDGDDILTSVRGNDTLLGGNGDDVFNMYGPYADAKISTVVTANGGDGKDTFNFLTMSSSVKMNVTGGKGVDLFSPNRVTELSQYVVTDFMPGIGGDQIDVQHLLSYTLGGNNPFGAAGVLRLIQRGGDAILQSDTDGPLGAKQFQDVITLKDVTVSDLSATNFVGGYSLDGSNTGLKIQGSETGEEFSGGYLNDNLAGNGGNDTISGGEGNDTIDGGDGDDRLIDSFGFNTFIGGAGDDTIIASGDNSNIGNGGDGNDTFLLTLRNSIFKGENGNDEFVITVDAYYNNYMDPGLRLFGGAGDDSFSYLSFYPMTIPIFATGGSGQDQYTLSSSTWNSKFNVLDFDLNNNGDQISIAHLFDKTDSNPFDSGKLLLTQSSKNTLVQFDSDGSGTAFSPITLLILENIDASKLTANHFAEHVNPLGGNIGLTTTGNLQSEQISGGWLNDNLSGLAGDDLLRGFANQDILDGGEGNDTLEGGAGDDQLKGGDGFDQASYANKFSNYAISKTSNGFVINDKTKLEGTDTVNGVEYLHFSDVNINLTMKEKAATISAAEVKTLIEIYVAFFNRIPDADGLSYWIDQVKSGTSMSAISESFYNIGASPQYASLTGFTANMSNADFIHTFYKNVLGRSEGADTGGLDYWMGKLAAGQSTRGSLAQDILNSAHTFKGNATYGYVADLLDNKYLVGKTLAIDWGITYNVDAYGRGVAIAKAVTPTDMTAALQLVGISASEMSFI